MQIDDTELMTQLARMEAKLDQLLLPVPVNVPTVAWQTVWADDFAAYPLGDLPTVWTAAFPWIAANQDGAKTEIVLVDGKKALKCSLTGAYHAQKGARAFFHPVSPRWDTFVPFEGKLVRCTYRQRFDQVIQCEPGDQLWTSAGLEIKDHDGPAAVAPDLVTVFKNTYFTLQHWTEQSHADTPKPVMVGRWFNVELLVRFSRGADGYSELRLEDGTRIHSVGPNMNAVDAGGAGALCLYSNNVVGGSAACYFDDFRVEVAA